MKITSRITSTNEDLFELTRSPVKIINHERNKSTTAVFKKEEKTFLPQIIQS